MNKGHTRTPWIQRGQTIRNENGQIIADCAAREETIKPIGGAERDANAAFIVRACNNHEALLAAAKSAVEAIDELIAEDDPFDMPPPWLDDLDQAIAAAEQGEKEEEQ